MIDYHSHSRYSGDSPAILRDMCARAVEIGVTEVAFTEHIDLVPHEWQNTDFHYEPWMREIESAREEFAGQLVIRASAEVDYQHEYKSLFEDFLASHEFDYIIGSVHYVGDIILEDHEKYFPEKCLRDAYLPYFEHVLAAVESGLFDTLGHMDLCKRYGVMYYGPFQTEDFKLEIEAILKAVIRQNMAIEINTSGLRQAPEETYPGMGTLRLYKELGGTLITLGTDSHRSVHVGAGLDVAKSMLDELSIRQLTISDPRWPNRRGVQLSSQR